MNLFLDYQEKIFSSLKNLNKKKIIQMPSNIKNVTVEKLETKTREKALGTNKKEEEFKDYE